MRPTVTSLIASAVLSSCPPVLIGLRDKVDKGDCGGNFQSSVPILGSPMDLVRAAGEVWLEADLCNGVPAVH